MTHYLRRNGETVVDVETTEQDLSCVIVLNTYSPMLLWCPVLQQPGMIADFHDLQEMRGEWHEAPGQKETPFEFVKRKLQAAADKYDLQYVTD